MPSPRRFWGGEERRRERGFGSSPPGYFSAVSLDLLCEISLENRRVGFNSSLCENRSCLSRRREFYLSSPLVNPLVPRCVEIFILRTEGPVVGKGLGLVDSGFLGLLHPANFSNNPTPTPPSVRADRVYRGGEISFFFAGKPSCSAVCGNIYLENPRGGLGKGFGG